MRFIHKPMIDAWIIFDDKGEQVYGHIVKSLDGKHTFYSDDHYYDAYTLVKIAEKLDELNGDD